MKYEHDSPAEWVREQAIALHTEGMDSGSEMLMEAAEVLFGVERAMAAQAEGSKMAMENEAREMAERASVEAVTEWLDDADLPPDFVEQWRVISREIPEQWACDPVGWVIGAKEALRAAGSLVGAPSHDPEHLTQMIYKALERCRAPQRSVSR